MFVLDACAIIAFLRNEAGAEQVEHALVNDECIAHSLNLYEIYKDGLQRGEDVASSDERVRELLEIGIKAREDMDPALWKDAAIIKNRFRQIAIPDCFALALSSRVGAPLLTSDHAELDPVAASGDYQVQFFR